MDKEVYPTHKGGEYFSGATRGWVELQGDGYFSGTMKGWILQWNYKGESNKKWIYAAFALHYEYFHAHVHSIVFYHIHSLSFSAPFLFCLVFLGWKFIITDELLVGLHARGVVIQGWVIGGNTHWRCGLTEMGGILLEVGFFEDTPGGR